METEKQFEHSLEYELVFKNERRKRELAPLYFGIGRHVIGRASSCDFQIKSRKVSAVHAVLEVTDQGIRIFDMNSTNGVLVNGSKSIVTDIKDGDYLAFAGYEYQIRRRAPISKVLAKGNKKKDTGIINPVLPSKPLLGHPLSLMLEVEKSEYIFENSEEVYPIFKYDIHGQSAEILVLFEDRVVSIDYVDLETEEIKLMGKEPQIDEPHVFFPYLKKKDSQVLISNSNKRNQLYMIEGFKAEKLTHKGIVDLNDKEFFLMKDDIVRFSKGELEIYIRKARKPPIVAAAPVMRRDGFFHSYVIPTVLALLIPLIIISFLNIEVEDNPEDKIQRIATILYNKRIVGDKPAESPKSNQGVVSTSKEPNPQNKKGELAKGTKIQAPKKQADIVEKKEPVKKATQKPTVSEKSKKQIARKRTKTPVKKSAKVKAFKNLDFSSSLNQLMVSEQRLRNTTNTSSDSGDINADDFSFEEGGAKRLKRIGANGNESVFEGIGNRVTQDIGAEGLSDKTSIYRIGIPGNAVVQGSVDGNDIANKLRSHLSQFRFCVEKQTRPGQLKTDRITMKFIIGASGYVTKGNIISRVYDSSIKGCMVNVLKGISFTPPRGGGVADISIPLSIGAR